MTDSPLVSVVMSVYNADRFLREAVESILDQTFKEFEFIIINDGSTDRSAVILEEFRQKDIRVVISTHPNNQGIVAALNSGLAKARGKYIARMDADDISLPHRLQDQVSWMDAHPQVDICGAWVELIGAAQGGSWRHPVEHASIHARMLFSNALAHPTVMMRASAVRKHGLMYDEKRIYIEDYDLWSRFLEKMQFANLDKILLRYRLHSQNTGVKYRSEQIIGHEAIFRRLLAPLQMEYTSQDLALHQKITGMQYEASLSFLYHSYLWLGKISRANRRTHLIPPLIMDAELDSHWFEICCHVLFQPVLGKHCSSGVVKPFLEKTTKFVWKLLCLIFPVDI